MAARDRFERPTNQLLALEVPRAALNAATLLPAWPLLLRAPRGDGHPVLVLPGFTASDLSTRVLRGYLRELGYHVHAWRLGRNLGPNRETIDGLRERVRQLADRHQQPMSIVGWSLGGIYAREIARATPRGVRMVITMGSPIRLRDRRASNAGSLFATVRPGAATGGRADPRPPEDSRGALPVPATAIYTRSDGVVPWQSCLEVPSSRSESVEVTGSHTGLGVNPAALWVIADRLGQPDGTWRPFRPPRGPAGRLFPRRHDDPRQA